MNDYNDPEQRLEISGQARAALADLMEVESYAWNDEGVLTLRGRLLAPSEQIYRTIRQRLEALGFTPFLQRVNGRDEIRAMPGVIERHQPRLWLPLLLFLLTIVTTLWTGAFYEGIDPLQNPLGIFSGWPFSATLLGILLTHEMGHYVVGRLRHAPVSLPYFIPLPPYLSIGTMGAVIVQREPLQDRRTVLEVGIAGPLAGLVVAIPLLIYGLATSPVGAPPVDGYLQEGNSLLYLGLKYLVKGQILPSNGLDVQLNSIAWGAWIGLLVTMLNLLPVGQLDGGHVAYAVLGDKAQYLSYVMLGLCVVLGLTVSNQWLIWAVLIFLIGPKHPAPLDSIAGLRVWDIALAIIGLLVFILLFMPAPLAVVMPAGS